LQDFENAQVALDALDAGFGEQVDDARLPGLAVTIDPAIALLEDHQRPGQIEMHQSMAEVMQVEAFGGDIGAQQDPHGVVLATKAIDQLLLLGVGHRRRAGSRSCAGFRPAAPGRLFPQPAQRFDPLGEDDQTV
jgi:hypothetical protein